MTQRRSVSLAAVAIWVIASGTGAAAGSPRAGQAAYPVGANGRIVYTLNPGGGDNRDVFVIGKDGANPTNLTPGSNGGEGHPVFSPNGKKIAFDRVISNPLSLDTWTMNPDGINQADITAGKLQSAATPSYSPDGKRIAVSAPEPGPFGNNGIFLINPDGSNPVEVTPANEPINHNNLSPDFSPDGKKLVFYRCIGPTCGISVINTDGSGLVNLTTGNGNLGDFYPEFSPDGRQIVFARDVSGTDADIFVMNADGSNQVDLTTSDPKLEADPSFSPDGKKIAFVRDVFPPSTVGGQNIDLMLMNPDGSGAVDLTKSAGNEFDPSWEHLRLCRRRRPTIVGGDGKDTIKGTKRADVIMALGGNDKIKGLAGRDLICGGAGNDVIKAGPGNDVVIGGPGKDTLRGGPGKDKLKGGPGKDKQVQ